MIKGLELAAFYVIFGVFGAFWLALMVASIRGFAESERQRQEHAQRMSEVRDRNVARIAAGDTDPRHQEMETVWR